MKSKHFQRVMRRGPVDAPYIRPHQHDTGRVNDATTHMLSHLMIVAGNVGAEDAGVIQIRVFRMYTLHQVKTMT